MTRPILPHREANLAPYRYDEMPYANDGQGYRPGDWFILVHAETSPCTDWDNCDGHLFVVLPCGCLFDAGRRASNCTRKDDRLHRCWVVEGVPPQVSLTKDGKAWPGGTCQAGAGSIGHEHWHGFLTRGRLQLGR